jgi:alanine dehydrogenase
MLIGVPKEIKTHEYRVALVPAGVIELKKHGHDVIIEKGAGMGSSFPDEQYVEAGASIVETAEEVWQRADMIMKVKEPIAREYPLIREGQILFTYFHFAASQELTEAVVKSKAVAIAYETVEKNDRSLPLLIPMSEVAGRMAAQEGAKYLEKASGGRGVLLGGIPGVRPANVMVLGGGIVGVNAARIAAGMGANVFIFDISPNRLRYLDEILPKNITTVFSSEGNIREMIPQMDLVIGAVLIPGAKAPHLVKKDMLKTMKPGAVVVDVAIDQGGCIETARPTTHDNPTYIVDDIVHYCVANMPGGVPNTSTRGLTNVTLPYAIQLANKGWKGAIRDNKELELGLNIADGIITYKDVAEAFGFDWKPVSSVLGTTA